jgi:hypothetical protein
MEQKWKSWSLSDWNAALVSAVFLGIERAANPITRVDATARFLARCTGGSGSSPEDARRSFLASFGNSPSRIRALYRWPRNRPLPRGRAIPERFAALYLTLLAGSADEITDEIGDFRQRLIELLNPVDVGSLPFEDLPAMWSYIARWSESRHAELGDCAILKLPEVSRSENRIGFSKQLAFPTFKDEIRLKTILEDSSLSDSSEFSGIARAVYPRIDTFSGEFRKEFAVFSAYVANAEFHKAYDSRFWEVVRDIALDEASESARGIGNYCLRLDTEDTYNVRTLLLFDDTARSCLPPTLKSRLVGRRDSLPHVATGTDGYPSLAEIAMAIINSTAFQSKVGRGFSAGWHTLLPDSLGSLGSDGAFYEGGPVAFLTTPKYAKKLREALSGMQIRFYEHDSAERLSGWSAFEFESITREPLRRLLGLAPPGIARLAKIGWIPPRIRTSGGAWLGQALLLNPASNPRAFLEGAVEGVFRLLDDNGAEVCAGGLLRVEDGFQIDPRQLTDIPQQAVQCEFTLFTEEGTERCARITLARSMLPSRPTSPSNPSDWLCEGSSGTLQPVETAGIEPPHPRPISAGLPADKFPPRLAPAHTEDIPVWQSTNTLNIPPAFSWLGDALSLRFERRATMEFRVLNEHLEGAAAAAEIPLWLLRRLLVEGQWLRRLLSRGAPYPHFAPSPRLMAVVSPDECRVRVAGMLSKADLILLKEAMKPHETASRFTAGPLSIGALELQLEAPHRITSLADLIAARVVRREDAPNPMAALTPEITWMTIDREPANAASMDCWLRDKRKWDREADTEARWLVGDLRRFRSHSASRFWYWVKTGDAEFIRTDDPAWGWLAAEAVSGRRSASIFPDGSIQWESNLPSLPPSLARWWLLFGGGCIAFSAKGQTIFTGPASANSAMALGFRPLRYGRLSPPRNIAIERRDLALRLSRITPTPASR